MKAEVSQQRLLLVLADVDAEMRRVEHRTRNLAEQQEFERAEAEHRTAKDALAVVAIELADLDGQTVKFESEIDSVRQREDRDRSLLEGGTVNSKQLSELQHELETLERRRASLEDSLLEVLELREQVQGKHAGELDRISTLLNEMSAAQIARDEALVAIDSTRQVCSMRRTELISSLDAELVAIYEKQLSKGGAGAGVLQGKRCGACRIEIDQGEMARITAAAEDDVLRCPECGAILLRSKDLPR